MLPSLSEDATEEELEKGVNIIHLGKQKYANVICFRYLLIYRGDRRSML